MQIVIDIPNEFYRKIRKNEYDYGDMNVIIQNGTPLPRGHGRLIDADALGEKEKMYKFKSVYRNIRTLKTRSILFCYEIPTSWILADFIDINELWQSVIKRSLQQLEQHEVLIDIHLISREENKSHE